MIKVRNGLSLLIATMLATPVGAYAAACTEPDWDPDFQYTGHESVTYESAHFKSKWWVKGAPPDRTDQWGPWEFLEECDNGETSDPVPVASPLSRSFNINGGSDVVFTLNTDGDTLLSVDNITQANTLDQSAYSLNGYDLTFAATYLSALGIGNYSFQLSFAAAAPLVVDIDVVDVTHQMTTLTPEDAVLTYDSVLTNGQIELKKGEAQWLYYAPVSGEYVVEFDYTAPYGEKTNTFYVGGNTQSVMTPQTDTIQTVSITANMSAGDQVIGVDGSEGNWGYIFLDNVRVYSSDINPDDPDDPPADPAISPASQTVQAGSGSSVNYSLDSGSYSFSSLSVDGVTLQQGTDYTVGATSVTLEAAYISTLAAGSYTFTANFEDAELGTSAVSAELLVESEPVIMPSLSPASISVQVDSGNSVSYSMDAGSYSFSSLSNGGTVLQQGTDYSVTATSLVLDAAYVSTLVVGSYTLTAAFDDAELGSESLSVQLRIDSVPVVMPSVSPSSVSVEAGSGASASYSIDSGSYSFSSVNNGGTVLVQGSDYTLSGTTLTLEAGYISTLAVGTYALTAGFNDAGLGSESVPFELRVDAPPMVMPSISPDSQTVNVSAPTALSFDLTAGSFEFAGVEADGVALQTSDYNYSADVLTLNESYVATLTGGQTVSYSALFTSSVHGDTGAQFSVTAMDALTGDCFDLSTITLEGGAKIEQGRAKIVGNVGSAGYWTVSLDKAGEYQVLLTYSTEGGDKIVSYMLNDGGRSNMVWPDVSPTSPQDMEFIHNLDAGVHRIGMINRDGDWGWASLHNLCVNFRGSLDITSPQSFDSLNSGSDIVVDFSKDASGELTYSVNGGVTQLYGGASPLVIPTTGDGIYDLQFGVAGTSLSETMRVQVGEAPGPFYVDTLGSQFVLGNKPFYFNGSNQYYLMYKPEPMAEDFFKRANFLGMTSVRTWMFCNDTKTHDGVCINMESGGEFLLTKANRTAEEQAIVDRSFELFDNYVALAHQYDIKLVLSLADHWDYFGNLDSYGAPHYSTLSSVEKFKAFITELLQHHNPLTGYTYAEDPAIMMWELANEPRCSSGCDADIFKAWASDVSSLLKTLAPNHLVSIGAESSFGHNGTGDDFNFIKYVNDLPTIDAISAHLYPTWWNMSDAETLANIDQLAEVGRVLNKPTYIGEFSWPVASEASVTQDLQTRYEKFIDWYARAEANKDAIGGVHAWQLSGLEWGNGETPLDACQWCAGPYGEPTGGWTANNDGFQMYCAMTPEEQQLTETGAPGANKEGDIIHIDLHKPVCDLLIERSSYYESLNQ